VARWEHTRVNGKARFIARVTLIWSGSMIIFNGLWDSYVEGHLKIWKLVFFLVAGPIVGLLSWWDSEGIFKAAKIDERARQSREQNSVHDCDA
jgi:hypothetical protein